MKIKLIAIQLILLSCICLYSEWISLDSYAGTVDPGAIESLTVSLDSEGLDYGTYNCEIRITSSNRQVDIVPVQLSVIPVFLSAPENLEITASDLNTELTWDPVPGSVGYKIYRSDTPNSGFTEIASVPGTSYEESSGGIKYFYRVTAYFTRIRIMNE